MKVSFTCVYIFSLSGTLVRYFGSLLDSKSTVVVIPVVGFWILCLGL